MSSWYNIWNFNEKDRLISKNSLQKFEITRAQLVLKFFRATSSVLMFSCQDVWNFSEKERLISKNSRSKFNESLKYQEQSWF